MEHSYNEQMDTQPTGLSVKLESLLATQPRKFDETEVVAEIRELAESCGGEVLFDLPAEQSEDHLSRWAVLRFMNDGQEQIVHVFLTGERGDYWIATDRDVPERYSSFTHTWMDVLTRWAAQSEITAQPSALQ